jgi:hypothetical protein
MRKKLKFLAVCFAILTIGCLAGACATNASEPAITSETSQNSAPATTAATTTAQTSAAQVETDPAVPTLPPNVSGKVEIRTISTSFSYAFNSYLITSVEGETAVVDPALMPKLKKLALEPVIICSTHKHDDHNDKTFTDSFDCEKILSQSGDVTVGSLHVFTIPCSHDGDAIQPDSTNVIIVFEVNGLRIAHMGDIGQTSLTEDQLEKLGEIDIAFMQFENSFSSMNLTNMKGFTLIEQLNPKIIIPTHYKEASIPVFEEKYGAITYYDDLFAIGTEDLPEETLNVVIIRNNYIFE